MTEKAAFILRFPDLSPETTVLTDLVRVLSDVDKAIKAVAEEHYLADPSELSLSLVAIQRGSNLLQFGASDPDLARSVWATLSEAVAEDRVYALPDPAGELVHSLIMLANKRKTSVEFRDSTASEPLAVVRPSVNLRLKVPVVRGETEIYGQVMRVGGKDPKVRIFMDEGYPITCTVSRELAQEIAGRLYHIVGLAGQATWDTSDWRILSFKLESLLPYEQTPITLAMKHLGEASGPDAWSDVEDIVEAITKLRQE